MGAGNRADLWAAVRNPAVVHGMCEDYRAGLGIDRDHEEADRAGGRRIACSSSWLRAGKSVRARHLVKFGLTGDLGVLPGIREI
jgi:hypothetical protein